MPPQVTNHIIIIPSSTIYIERLLARPYGKLAVLPNTEHWAGLGEELQLFIYRKKFCSINPLRSPHRHLLVLVKTKAGAVKEILLSGTTASLASDSQKGSRSQLEASQTEEKIREVRINKDCQ